jgi:dihydroxy-acid dehydratase
MHWSCVTRSGRGGGPIALIEDGDLIEIDIPTRKINIVGITGVAANESEVKRVLSERKAAWKLPVLKPKKGVLKRYSQNAVSAMAGAYMK